MHAVRLFCLTVRSATLLVLLPILHKEDQNHTNTCSLDCVGFILTNLLQLLTVRPTQHIITNDFFVLHLYNNTPLSIEQYISSKSSCTAQVHVQQINNCFWLIFRKPTPIGTLRTHVLYVNLYNDYCSRHWYCISAWNTSDVSDQQVLSACIKQHV